MLIILKNWSYKYSTQIDDVKHSKIFLGSSRDSVNSFQSDLHPLIVPAKRKRNLSSSTKHIPKTHCKEGKEDRRKSLEPSIS